MTDTPEIPPVVEVQENGTTLHNVTVTTDSPSPKKFVVWRRRPTYLIIGGLISAVLFMGVAFFTLQRESLESIANLTEDVRLLRSALIDAEQEIDDAQVENRELVACRAAFNNAVSEATSLVVIELTELLVLLSQDGDTTVAVDEIQEAGRLLNVAQAGRSAYEAGGAALPCPIAVAPLE